MKQSLALFYFSLVVLGSVLLLSGSIVYALPETFNPASIVFFVLGGLFAFIGLLGLFLQKKEK